jgi:ATP-binding cassette, subfamily B, bacterial
VLWNVGRAIRKLYEALANADEMIEILNTPHEVKDARNAKELQVQTGRIEFQNVYFSFNKTRRILKDMNLVIKPKEKVALVGPSGAGKSTITKLLFRFFDVERGKIIVGNQNIAKVTQDSLRENIALVPQEPILFHRTIMDNIRYGRRDAMDKEVIEAAKRAHAHEFIEGLQDGYETFVGERGVKLSGGERQRVAIARAILKNAPILVLDEATSSLDSESEALIQEALEELMRDKTTIVIAHRLSTIMKMDRIVVIEDGKVTESGTHKQLLRKKDNIYKKLWEIQAGGFIE